MRCSPPSPPRPVARRRRSPEPARLPPAAGGPAPAARRRRADPAAAVPPSSASRSAASGAIPSRGPGPAVPRRRRSHFLFLPPAGRAATCSPRGSGTCGDGTGPTASLRPRPCLFPHGSRGEFPPSSLPLQYGWFNSFNQQNPHRRSAPRRALCHACRYAPTLSSGSEPGSGRPEHRRAWPGQEGAAVARLGAPHCPAPPAPEV